MNMQSQPYQRTCVGRFNECGRPGCWVCDPQPKSSTARPALIYVSGPMTTGQFTANIRRGLDVGKALIERGFAVVVPHEKVMTEILHPMTYAEWLDYDFRIILCCDAVYRMPGESHGGDAEVAFARKHGVPVYFDLDLLVCDQKLQGLVRP